MAYTSGQHPRLLFDAAGLEQLRRDVRTGLRAQLLDLLRQRCEHYMDSAHPDYMDFRERNKEMWRLRSGYFYVVPALEELAFYYALAQDRRAGEYARDMLMEIIDKGLADVRSSAWGLATDGWRHGPGHDKGKFSKAIALVYDLCYDLFTPAQRARFASYAQESVDFAMQHWAFDWWQVANNRGSRAIIGMAWICLALEGEAEITQAAKHIFDGWSAMEHYLFLAYDDHGAPFEGPGYAGMMAFMTLSAIALARHGEANLLTNNRFERFPEYLAYEMLPGGGTANPWNDCQFENGTVSGSVFLMGTPAGRLIPWLARQYDMHPTRGLADLKGDVAFVFLLHWKDGVPELSPVDLKFPLARFFSGRGIVSMRTGWGPQDWLVSTFCGRQQYKCHRQGDFNHVSLYALGEQFLVDAGYGWPQADTTQAMNRRFAETYAHNNVSLNGSQQRGTAYTPGWPEGSMLDYQHNENFTTTLGDASSSTGPDHRVRRSLRRTALVRNAPVPFLVVVDLNENDGNPFKAEAHWHTLPENCVEVMGRKFVINGRKNRCHGEVLFPRDAKVTLEEESRRPQIRVVAEGAVVETVTIFCPCREDEQPPEFSVKRESEGMFAVTCRAGDRSTTIHLGTALVDPLRQPVPVRVE